MRIHKPKTTTPLNGNPTTKGPASPSAVQARDQRTVAMDQQGFQESADRSPQALRVTQFQKMADAHRKAARGPAHFPVSNVTQGKFDTDGAWMQDVDDTTLTDKFGSTTSALWKALREHRVDISIRAGASTNYDFSTQVLSLASEWHKAIKDYVQDGTKTPNLARAISALTHEMSHAHDHLVRKESLSGKSSADDSRVKAVLKTELRAWMKEARSGRENVREKALQSNDDDNNLIFSWVALKFLLDDGTDVLQAPESNVVVGRLKKYFNDNKSSETSTTLADLLRDEFHETLVEYAGLIRAKFASDDGKLRGLAGKYMH